jgi:hypothetical protein
MAKTWFSCVLGIPGIEGYNNPRILGTNTSWPAPATYPACFPAHRQLKRIAWVLMKMDSDYKSNTDRTDRFRNKFVPKIEEAFKSLPKPTKTTRALTIEPALTSGPRR